MIEQVVIVGLAAWRVTAMLAYEDGPGAAFERVRRLSGVPATGEVRGFIPSLLTCPWCLSVWAVAAMWGLWYIDRAIPAVLAAMTVAIAVERWAHHD